ncbi:MAG: arsenate reductase family protein [Ruminococcus sp.]|nr:arsenate reductase family protein [Ruminococcus sp.]MDE7226100.1 arsenate reductase family protein [Ruminococcus sp.]
MIQIFGTKKCSDTRKAERYFKERGIKYQFIDMKEKGMSRGEFNSVIQSAGGIDEIINENAKDKQTLTLMRYLSESDRTEKLFENQQLIRTPIVRSGKKSCVGYCSDVWKNYIE